MVDIFVSYSSADRDLVAPLGSALAEHGWSVWWDRNIPPGKTFDEVIEAALDEAKAVVCIWTENGIASRWVRTEAAEGAARQILIPVLMEDVPLPLAFRRIQTADLIGWEPGKDHPGFTEVVAALEELIPGSHRAPQQPPSRPTVEPPAREAQASAAASAAEIDVDWARLGGDDQPEPAQDAGSPRRTAEQQLLPVGEPQPLETSVGETGPPTVEQSPDQDSMALHFMDPDPGSEHGVEGDSGSGSRPRQLTSEDDPPPTGPDRRKLLIGGAIAVALAIGVVALALKFVGSESSPALAMELETAQVQTTPMPVTTATARTTTTTTTQAAAATRATTTTQVAPAVVVLPADDAVYNQPVEKATELLTEALLVVERGGSGCSFSTPSGHVRQVTVGADLNDRIIIGKVTDTIDEQAKESLRPGDSVTVWSASGSC